MVLHLLHVKRKEKKKEKKKKQITYFFVIQRIKITFSYNANIQRRNFFQKSPFNFQSFKDEITPSALLKYVHLFFYIILIK